MSGWPNHDGFVLLSIAIPSADKITEHVFYFCACMAWPACRAGRPVLMLFLSNFNKHHIYVHEEFIRKMNIAIGSFVLIK